MIFSLSLVATLFSISSPPAGGPEPEPIAVPSPEQVQGEAESGAGPVPPPEQVQGAAESGAGPVPPPEQVQGAAESGAGPVPPPEQVQSAAESGAGAMPPPGQVQPRSNAKPPDPRARPSEGVYAVGSSGVAPLPPAPPPVPPSTIPRGSWRGDGWLSLRLHVVGPLYGEVPGRPTVISLGGGAEGGWRIRQWIAVGAGFARQPHEVYRDKIAEAPAVITRRGHLSTWDVAFLRLYAPVRGRIDPYLDVGGGVAFFDPARNQPILLGGTVRASIGIEAWVTRNTTLGIGGLYRANFVDDSIGHAWQATLDLGLHW
ncbi:hypothetical protein ENSA5_58790 [Enhygromyxa salina]|uniref:Outer membrane protein beta-barrel domain-containing protein n=1 Tax=Enhygromyxa salina TaxID=215803 RepID=A0A2S9XDY2_9BACT|nr:hypothetical protein [Enhygromyxa salina]PRP91069.1 hypothetical protein ENSA5_58790 [Enhygromyxa salina]